SLPLEGTAKAFLDLIARRVEHVEDGLVRLGITRVNVEVDSRTVFLDVVVVRQSTPPRSCTDPTVRAGGDVCMEVGPQFGFVKQSTPETTTHEVPVSQL